jgi:hypothetical protein
METSGSTIYCPLHPKEAVKRIDIEFGAEKELFCIECLLQITNPVAMSSQLKSVDDFVDMAASYYASNRKRCSDSIDTPEEFLEILEKQTENLEVLSKHVEEEKKRVDLKFDEITKDVFKMINLKRDEYFHMLDKQLFNYRYGFIFFEKQLRKAFPKEDDAGLYPTKEELFTKLGKLQNATQMMAFVKNIKEDLNENKLFSNEDGNNMSHDEARKYLIKTISTKLDTYKAKCPTLIDPEADMNKVRTEFEKATTKVLDNVFTLNNEIEDIATGDAFPKSSLLKQQDFQMVRKWLEKEFASKKWKLVFKGTKDGMTANAFHNSANNKGPTVTVIKSKHGKTFGGFVPESWTSRGSYINSSQTFLFSITNKAKYPSNQIC